MQEINDRFSTRLKIPIPGELILVVIAALVSYFAQLNERFDLAVIGGIPTGLQTPSLPPFNGRPTDYITDAIVLAIIAFAVSISMAKLMAEKHRLARISFCVTGSGY